MEFITIKDKRDIEKFLNKTNAMHDGHIISVQYSNCGISKEGGGYLYDPQKTKLNVKILITSIYDAVVELEFEHLLEWQIKDNSCISYIFEASVTFSEQGFVVWTDDILFDINDIKGCSYAIAESMKWRIVE